MKRASRTGVVILLILALAAGGAWLFRSQSAAQTTTGSSDTYTQIVEVTQGSLRATINVVGELVSSRQVDLKFARMSGSAELLRIGVEAGHKVTAGQELAAIDPAPYRQAVDEARSALEAAEKKLAELETPATELELAQADLAIAKAEYQLAQAQDALDELLHPDIAALQAKVAEAETTLAKAQADLAALLADRSTEEKLSRLRDTEAKASAEYSRLANETYSDSYYQDRLQVAYNKMMDAIDARITAELQAQINILKAQMQVTKAERALAQAREELAEAQAGGDELELAKARLAVREAEVALAKAREDRADLEEGADAVTLASARADVERKRLALAEAEAALAGTTLTAPFDGTVLAVYVEPGDTINANTRILTLANLGQLEVIASVDETAIRQVSAGQDAQITFDALPGYTLRGKVLEVPLQGTLQGNVMVYEVPISLEGAENLPLLVGMTANVQIVVGQVENALLVPAMAVQKSSGMYQVLVVNPDDPTGTPQAVPVEVGLSDGVNTQIVRGLNLGDKVVMQISSAQSGQFNWRMMMMGGGAPPPGPAGGSQPRFNR